MEGRDRRRVNMAVAAAVMLSITLRMALVKASDGSGSVSASVGPVSGVIRAEEIVLSSLYGGRIVSVAVADGDHVVAGQQLIAFDTTIVDAQVVVAQAKLAVSQAVLQRLEAGARPTEAAIAEAQLAQAKTVREAALTRLADARTTRSNLQEADMQIAVGELRVESAKHRLQEAIALKEAAEQAKDTGDYLREQIREWALPVSPPALPEELDLATYDWWEAWAGVDAASASLEQAQSELEHWQSLKANPRDADTEVAVALATVAETEAAVTAAQAKVDGYHKGPTIEELNQARMGVKEAQTAVQALLDQGVEMPLEAPIDAVVLQTNVHAGEVVARGASLVVIADLSEVRLRVYVPETYLGQVRLDQSAVVEVDAFPARNFEGRVLHIAAEAEYTPRNVVTMEERVNTVFAVDILLPNPQGLLKPGMSADATLVP